MKDVILERCCGNCEWSISPIDEEEIMKENHYVEDDPTRPRAGDCCLGMEHNGEFVCYNHEYLSGGLVTYAFYDDKYLGEGYFVVTKYYDYIIRFLKLYRIGSLDNYSYGIRVYELSPIVNKSDGVSKNIFFNIAENDNGILYTAIKILAKVLGNYVIRGIDNNSFMTVDINKYSVSINFTEIINDKYKNSDYIDINVSDVIDEKIYKLIGQFYRNMAVVTENMKDEDTFQKVRIITRK